MNHTVRNYLIKLAKQGGTTYYSQIAIDCELGLNLSLTKDRNKLADQLGEIAIHEFYNSRPLLTALVHHKGKPDSYGIGFYNICEYLGIGKKDKLEQENFASKERESCFEYWQNIVSSDTSHSISFFTPEELNTFSSIAGKGYKKGDPESLEMRNAVTPIYKKTNYWANSLNLEGLTIQNDNRWQISGYFKKYSWCRIYRTEDQEKGIFFTLGIHGVRNGEIFLKLDCQRSNYNNSKTLSKDQVARFDFLLAQEGHEWFTVPDYKIAEYSWDDLIQKTRQYISSWLEVYDQVIDFVWAEDFINEPVGLQITEPPIGKHSELPEKQYSFKGKDTDHLARYRNQIDLGARGEQLVIEHEALVLKKIGRSDLASQVRKVKDGEGYDIRSFHSDGSVKFIEVKTTRGGIDTPFHISDNELAFLRSNIDNYYLYRIYDFKTYLRKGKMFILHKDIDQRLLLRPTDYQVLIKRAD